VKRALGRNDVELMLVVVFWAFNVSVVKVCLREMQPLAFNILRFVGAAVILLVLTRWLEGSFRVERKDIARVVMLGVVGHTLYQLCFVLGLARTTASSTALIFGSSPVVIAILSRLAGHERLGLTDAAGALLAFYGVYLIVQGHGGAPVPVQRVSTIEGNLLIIGAVLCWSIYTVMARDLLHRYSALKVTALTLTLGTVLMAPPSIPDLIRQDWGAVSLRTWAGLVFSFVFAVVIAYVFWYRSVKKVGNLRTAIYTNLVPVFGTLFGVWLLGEPLTRGLWLGGACILAGIVLTRLKAPRAPVPAEGS